MEKNPHAVALGRLGGKQRARKLSSAERSRIARSASLAAVRHVSSAERRKWGLLGARMRWGKES